MTMTNYYTIPGTSQPIQLDKNNNFIDPATGELMHVMTVEEMPCNTFGAELYAHGTVRPERKLIDEDFGTICVCAVRYCFGRQTYMPSLVQDFVCRNFKHLNDNELKVMVDDINFAERINQLGDERIDKPDWLKFRERINSELDKRKAEQNA